LRKTIAFFFCFLKLFLNMDLFSPGPRSAVTLRQVHGFLLAGKLLSFSDAATSMHISQSAFSQLIREMERVLDLRLFERTTRHVELTEAGQLLYQKMQLGFAQIDDACAEARALARGERGHVTMGTLSSLAVGVVTRALSRFVAQQPHVRIAVREDYNGALLDRVVSGELDFALCAYANTASELEFEQLCADELVLLYRQGSFAMNVRAMDWSSLRDAQLIVYAGNTSSHEQVLISFLASDIAPPSSLEVNTMFTAVSMVRAGLGFTFVPRLSLGDIDLSGLAWCHMEAPAPTRRIGIFKRRDRRFSPAAVRLLEQLRPELATAMASRPLALV